MYSPCRNVRVKDSCIMTALHYASSSGSWIFAWVAGCLVILASPLMTSATSCDVSLALACRASGPSDVTFQTSDNVTESTVLAACSITAREDLCFSDHTATCDSSNRDFALSQWQANSSNSRSLCLQECTSYNDVVQCAKQASAVDLSESHRQFCREFERGLTCSSNFSSTCNVSRHLFERLVGTTLVHQFFAYCHSDEYIENSEGCRPDQAASCLAQLRYHVDSFLHTYYNGTHQPYQLLQACRIALEEDNSTECYHMVMQECSNSSVPQPAELMYQDLLNETGNICEAECNGFRGVKKCFSGVKLDALNTDLVTFCRSYGDALECSLAATPGCNMSADLLHALAGEHAAHVYGVFCLQGGSPVPVSDTCNPAESERCFLDLQDNFDSFLSSYLISNHSRREVSHICTAVTQGNELTHCFQRATQTCPTPDQDPATVQFQMLLDDIQHICMTECPGLAGVRACTNLANFSLLNCKGTCTDYKPFCRSVEGARQCLAQLNCAVAEDILNEIMPQEARAAEMAHCRGESCFSDSLMAQLPPSSGAKLDKPVCSQFLAAFSCVLRECGERRLSNCTSQLESRIQNAISTTLPRCERLLKESNAGGPPPTMNGPVQLLSLVTVTLLLFLNP